MKNVGQEVSDFLDSVGVNTGIVIIKDPDSELVLTIKRGENVWLVGAVRLLEQDLIHRWMGTSRD